MFRQITLIKLKSGITDQQLAELSSGFSKLSNIVSGIHRFDFGPDKNLEDLTMDYALVIDFESEAYWKEYRAHPDHVCFAKNAMNIIARVERVQYEVKQEV